MDNREQTGGFLEDVRDGDWLTCRLGLMIPSVEEEMSPFTISLELVRNTVIIAAFPIFCPDSYLDLFSICSPPPPGW